MAIRNITDGHSFYNGFMLTASENYGIVTAAGKNLLPLKKSWLERPGK